MAEKDPVPMESGSGVPPDEEKKTPLEQFEFWLKDLAGGS